ncbi:hypothetical protein [Mycobacterium sp. URHB0044]|uniref:hypothetical protein n=1 Tax=Mycobacterium sp. URHB0044 TaxID=1380386 RepID=UPI00048CE4A2|nr:hypothetical protein [Mycobacterium sp. URHB0044]
MAMLVLGVGGLTGCGTQGGGATAGSEPAATTTVSATTAASTTVASSPPGVPDTVAACQAGVRMSGSIPPGADPDEPDPTPQQMKDWAATVVPDFEVFAASVPTDLANAVATQRAELQKAQRGERLNVQDPASTAASNAIGGFLFDECGLQRLDAVSADGRLGPMPTTLHAGPVVVRFANTGEPSRDAFVLLVARVRDGATVSVQDVTSEKVDFADVADVVSGVQPGDGRTGYGAFTLAPGRYLAVSVLGVPPEFSGGVDAAEFTVA